MCSWIPIVHILFSFFIRFHKIDFYLGHKEEGAGKRERSKKWFLFLGKLMVIIYFSCYLLGGKICILNKDFLQIESRKRQKKKSKNRCVSRREERSLGMIYATTWHKAELHVFQETMEYLRKTLKTCQKSRLPPNLDLDLLSTQKKAIF